MYVPKWLVPKWLPPNGSKWLSPNGSISTQGTDIDVLVTQGGIAVNPKNEELKINIKKKGLPVVDIELLKEKTERITGKPKYLAKGERVVAEVVSRYGEITDRIYEVRT